MSDREYLLRMIYPHDLTVLEARKIYFSNSGFSDHTYTDRWAKLPFLWFHIYLPNFSGRRKAIPLHDINHILTEYKTDWWGEWQIGAYEIGTGCGPYWAGWIISLQGIIAGAIFAPRKSVQAFARGRRSKGVYHFSNHESLLLEKVGDLRENTTAPNETVSPTVIDAILFYSIVLLSITAHIAPFALLIFLLSR